MKLLLILESLTKYSEIVYIFYAIASPILTHRRMSGN
jgi:hypothetical protein